MDNSKSSFKQLPPQMEWLIFVLLFSTVIIAYSKRGWVLIGCVTTFLILLNSWISSKAVQPKYSDSFFIVDVFTGGVYIVLLLLLYNSSVDIPNGFWICSMLICCCYLIWDFLLLQIFKNLDSGSSTYKTIIKKYIFILVIASVFFLFIYLGSKNIIPDLNLTILKVLGIGCWAGILSLWTYDKYSEI